MEHEHHSHHDHHHDESFGLVLWLNIIFAIIEVIAAALSNSQALLADAVHDAGDSISILLAIYFNKKAKKGTTNKYTFGYKRYKILGAFITSVVLVVGSSLVLFYTITNFNTHHYLNTRIMFIVAVFGLLLNLIGVIKLKNNNRVLSRSIMLHLLEDVIGWVGLIITSVIIYFTGWLFLDSLLSIGLSIFIIYQATKNLKEIILLFLNTTPDDIDVDLIKQQILEIKEVEEIYDVHVFMIDEDLVNFTCHVISKVDVINEIRAILHNHDIEHITIQIDKDKTLVDQLH